MRDNSVMTMAAIKSAASEIGKVTLPICKHSDEKVSAAAVQANQLAQEIHKIVELIEKMERYSD